jgi:hypothetical protein
MRPSALHRDKVFSVLVMLLFFLRLFSNVKLTKKKHLENKKTDKTDLIFF